MNVNKWETLGEKNSADSEKGGLGIAVHLSICGMLLAHCQLLIWTKHMPPPKGPNPCESK